MSTPRKSGTTCATNRRLMPVSVCAGLRALAIAVPILILASKGYGQSSGPIRLGPPKTLAPAPADNETGAPETDTGSTPLTPSLAPKPPSGSSTSGVENTDRRAPSGFSVNDLSIVTIESTGTLNNENGGLGANMWQGTVRSKADRLVPMLPSRPSSRVMRDLQRRLLLTAAIAPDGPGMEGQSLVSLRARAGLALGLGEELQGFLATLPDSRQDEALDLVVARAQLGTGDVSGACGLATLKISAGSKDIWWQKLSVFCSALSGQKEQSDVGATLLIELGDDDPVFQEMLRVLNGDANASIPPLTAPRTLDIAMLTAIGRPFPSTISGNFSNPALRAFATNSNESFQSRLLAAELAEDAGLIRYDELSSIYDRIEIGDGEIDSILNLVEADPGPNSRALLYRAASTLPVDLARAQAIQKALEVGTREGRYLATVRLYLDQILAIDPSSTLSWFAFDAAKACLAAGRNAHARRWLLLADREAEANPDPDRPYIALWPYTLFRELAPQENLDTDLRAWWSDARSRDPIGAAGKAAFLIGLLQALGQEIGNGVWVDLVVTPLAGETTGAAFQTLRAMEDAAAGNRRAETVLLAAIALGETPLHRLNAEDIIRVVGALSNVGLVEDARALAVEAALARDI